MDGVWDPAAVRTGEIEYARAGEHHIAYREYRGDIGAAEDIVMVNGQNFPMESLRDDPIANRLLEGLASLGRLITFDRRGIALSDPISDWETPLREQWAEDLAAVIGAAGCDRPTVFSWMSAAVARTCSVLHRGLIGRMVLFNPAAPVTEADAVWMSRFGEQMERLRAGDLAGPQPDGPIPGRDGDPAYQIWNDAAGRAGASPRTAERMETKGWSDPPIDHARVETPTLVIQRSPAQFMIPQEYFCRAAHEIPGAELVDLGDGDMVPFGLGLDDLLAAISQYVVGEVRLPSPERQIAVILFTDLVGSTRRAVSSGDAAWNQLLDHHDAVSRHEVSRRSGRVIKTTGDGILALLPSATAAIHAAQAIRAGLEEDDLAVRIGIHVGEIDRRGDDVSGLAVNITARIMATAEPGQILTSAVVDQVTELALAQVGPRTLKDIDGTWVLHTIE